MAKGAANTSRDLEKRVANAYRRLGARKVERDVVLAGNRIDVYVELETPGRLLHRIAVEVKDLKRTVGIDIVNNFARIADLLRGKQMRESSSRQRVSASRRATPPRSTAFGC
jgi:hypothetical protein